MLVSKNTVVFRVELPVGLVGADYVGSDGKTGVLANAVSGAMDVASEQDLAVLEEVRATAAVPPQHRATAELLRQRGYLYDTADGEKQAYQAVVDNYFTAIQQAPFQFMMIPSFVCNLACPYCFEGELTAKSPRMTEEMIDAAFDCIPIIQDLHDNSGQPYITLFGGEPLLDTPAQRASVEQILRRSYDRGYPVTAITNGVDLDAYVPMLKRYECQEVQVSLDGTPPIHDQRRIFRGGRPTFGLIERSVDVATAAGIRVLIRMLVDRETVDDLPRFAEHAKSKGWIGNPLVTIFYGFTKRTAFLYVTPEHDEDRRLEMVRGDVAIGLQDQFFRMLRENPLVDEMLRPDPARIRSAVLEGDRVHPNLQGCSAGTSVIAFDPSARLYGCPETVGRPQHACGSYFPELRYRGGYREPWRHRFVDTVEMCRACNVKLFCGGGGCPIKAWAASGGDFNTCYCPKVETVKSQVERELAYLLPKLLRGQGAGRATAGAENQRENQKETPWEQLKRAGSFPWMS
jgi:uncharacterized protein